jgi:CheY-like chemotaxis protein
VVERTLTKAILIAEDDENDAALLIHVLRAAGVANPILDVADGNQVIAYLSGAGEFRDRRLFPLPSVLFLDLKMPRANGFQVLDWLRLNPPKHPMLVVAVTGFLEYKNAQRAFQFGAHTFLNKPCTTEDVRNLRQVYAGYWETSPREILDAEDSDSFSETV